MSWSRRDFCRAAAGVSLTVLAGGLAGCGFQPLHAKGEDDLAVSNELASVRIDPLRDRVGQQMHNFLRDRINPQGQPVAPNYHLKVELTEKLSETGVRRDETATRANLRMTAEFALIDAAGETVLYSGQSSSTTSYDILDNPFASTVSERDARERALREVADDIRTRLALYFSRA